MHGEGDLPPPSIIDPLLPPDHSSMLQQLFLLCRKRSSRPTQTSHPKGERPRPRSLIVPLLPSSSSRDSRFLGRGIFQEEEGGKGLEGGETSFVFFWRESEGDEGEGASVRDARRRWK